MNKLNAKPRLCTAVVLLIAWCFGQGSPAFTQDDPAAERPVFAVGRKRYTLLELTGLTERQWKERFAREVKDMPTETIRKILTSSRKADFTKTDRGGLEAALWKLARVGLLEYLSLRVGLAHIGEAILREQGVDAAAYFDLPLIREALQKQARYIRCLYDSLDQPDKDEALFTELTNTHGIAWDKKFWMASRKELRRFPAVSNWAPTFRDSPLHEDIAVKVVLAHALVQEACLKGTYHQRAADPAQFSNSLLRVYEIKNYTGDPATLREFFCQASDGQGTVSEAGVRELREWLLQVAPAADITASSRAGWGLLGERLTVPLVGEPELTGQGAFRVLSWARKVPPSEIERNTFAYRLAAADYLPRIESFEEGWQPNVALISETLGQDGFDHVASEMRPRKSYVKKPYPAEAFAEAARHRRDLQTFAVQAARLSAGRDREAALKLVSTLRHKANEVRMVSLQEQYRSLADRLERDVKEADESSPRRPERP